MRTPKLPEIPADEEVPPYSEQKSDKEQKDGTVKAPPADPPKKKDAEEDEFEALAKRFEALKKR